MIEEIQHPLLSAEIDWHRLLLSPRLARQCADRLMQMAHGAVARWQRQVAEDGFRAAGARFGAERGQPWQDCIGDDL